MNNQEQINRIKRLYEQEAVSANIFIDSVYSKPSLVKKLPSMSVLSKHSDMIELIGCGEVGLLIIDKKSNKQVGAVTFTFLTDCPDAFQINTLNIATEHKRKGYATECIKTLSLVLSQNIGRELAIMSDCDGESDGFMSVLKKMGAKELIYKNAFGLNMVAWSQNPNYDFDKLITVSPNDLSFIEKRSTAKINQIMSVVKQLNE